MGARLQGREDVLLGGVAGERDDARLGLAGTDLLGCLDAAHAGHLEVHQDHVGPQAFDRTRGLLAVLGFADHLDARLAVEQGSHALAHDRVVVSQQHANGALLGFGQRGTSTRTHVPPPGELWMCRLPPRRAARSHMPGSPKPPPPATAGSLKPRPTRARACPWLAIAPRGGRSPAARRPWSGHASCAMYPSRGCQPGRAAAAGARSSVARRVGGWAAIRRGRRSGRARRQCGSAPEPAAAAAWPRPRSRPPGLPTWRPRAPRAATWAPGSRWAPAAPPRRAGARRR
jgi:hypothetical protein